MDSEDYFLRLIHAVEVESLLYDRTHPNYSDKSHRNKAWIRISRKVGRDRIDCEKRWRLLREKYGRILKAKGGDSQSYSDREDKYVWPYFEHLQFMRDHFTPRRVRGAARDNASTVFSLEETELNLREADVFYSPTFCKREQPEEMEETEQLADELKNAICALSAKIAEDGDDEDEMFVRTILTMMKPFHTLDKDKLKSQIFNLIILERRKLFK